MSVEFNVKKIVQNHKNVLSIISKYENDVNKPKLIIVTKKQPVNLLLEMSRKIPNLIFGENRVQEALPKITLCGNTDITWHFIGYLQRNKVKKVLENFSLIESLDRMELAVEIDKWASKLNLMAKCLLQIDICQDGSKSGIYPSVEAVKEFLEEISILSNVQIQGLMTIAPYVSPEETRIYFRRMREIYEKVKNEISLPQNVEMQFLSMGMSNDYVIALEEGSNCIRLGTAIFK
ncbi:MAG: YggS family pyridoxal phosphate-dependent enzyme [Candidatus Hodarchaeales archaeon]|jgi:pyridoxal phosphate enzyme (YggS family)